MVADTAYIECADVTSAKATQWNGRAPKPTAGAPKSREPVPDIATTVKAGYVEDITASFLAILQADE